MTYKNRIIPVVLFIFLIFQSEIGICMERETLPLPADRIFNHAVSLLELSDGTLLVAWSSGSKEKNRDTAIVLSFKSPIVNNWSEPQILIDTPNRADGNPIIFLLNNEIYCFYSYLWGTGWSTARLFYTKSKLNVLTGDVMDINFSWTSPKRVFPFYKMGDLGRGKPVILDNKGFLLPLYKEFSGYYSYVCEFIDGKIIYNSALIKSSPGNLQPAIVQVMGGELLMLMRPERGGYFWQSFSKDKGKTWSKPEQRKDLFNPGSGFDLLRLASGNIILVFNDDSKSRTNLTIALSEDNGKSFPIRKILEEEEDVDFAYPSAIQDLKGKINIVYSVDKKEIRHIVLDEEEIYSQISNY
ncbi:exo-alpha-sialidase [bacterium]|nr:exo-alpha-sialidase [bacterium]